MRGNPMRTTRILQRRPGGILSRVLPVVALAAWWLAAADGVTSQVGSEGGAAAAARMPDFDDRGRLLLPADVRTWILAGASKGLSYTEGAGGGEMFHETLIEPSAYQHFVRTGSFRQGTMLALLLHSVGKQVLPQRRGSFAGSLHGVEIAVKSSERFAGGWGYFGFGPAPAPPAAAAFPRASCSACHEEHAATDNVFTQFYPLLTSAAATAVRAAGAI